MDETTFTKLKLISAFENLSVKALMEKAELFYVEQKEKERLASLTDEEKEDIGLLLLMSQLDMDNTVSEEKFLKVLEE